MTIITKNVAEIEEEIRSHGHIEWRSKKNLDDYVLNNAFEKGTRIVGYISPRTIQKWGLELHRETPCDVYVGVRNNSVCYLYGLLAPQPVDYSRYYYR